MAVLLSWIVIRQLIVFLDRLMPWQNDELFVRLLIQVPVVFTGFNLAFFATMLIRVRLFSFWPIDWAQIWRTDYPLTILFMLLLNFLYYYLWQQQLAQERKPKVEVATTPRITVSKGKTTTVLTVDQIAFAYRENDINFVMSNEEVTYFLDGSLSALEPLLPDFFRLNRQCLASKKAVLTYGVLPNRNLVVSLKGYGEKTMVVNKNRAAAFRRWLNSAINLSA